MEIKGSINVIEDSEAWYRVSRDYLGCVERMLSNTIQIGKIERGMFFIQCAVLPSGGRYQAQAALAATLP